MALGDQPLLPKGSSYLGRHEEGLTERRTLQTAAGRAEDEASDGGGGPDDGDQDTGDGLYRVFGEDT